MAIGGSIDPEQQQIELHRMLDSINTSLKNLQRDQQNRQSSDSQRILSISDNLASIKNSLNRQVEALAGYFAKQNIRPLLDSADSQTGALSKLFTKNPSSISSAAAKEVSETVSTIKNGTKQITNFSKTTGELTLAISKLTGLFEKSAFSSDSIDKLVASLKGNKTELIDEFKNKLDSGVTKKFEEALEKFNGGTVGASARSGAASLVEQQLTGLSEERDFRRAVLEYLTESRIAQEKEQVSASKTNLTMVALSKSLNKLANAEAEGSGNGGTDVNIYPVPGGGGSKGSKGGSPKGGAKGTPKGGKFADWLKKGGKALFKTVNVIGGAWATYDLIQQMTGSKDVFDKIRELANGGATIDELRKETGITSTRTLGNAIFLKDSDMGFWGNWLAHEFGNLDSARDAFNTGRNWFDLGAGFSGLNTVTNMFGLNLNPTLFAGAKAATAGTGAAAAGGGAGAMALTIASPLALAAAAALALQSGREWVEMVNTNMGVHAQGEMVTQKLIDASKSGATYEKFADYVLKTVQLQETTAEERLDFIRWQLLQRFVKFAASVINRFQTENINTMYFFNTFSGSTLTVLAHNITNVVSRFQSGLKNCGTYEECLQFYVSCANEIKKIAFDFIKKEQKGGINSAKIYEEMLPSNSIYDPFFTLTSGTGNAYSKEEAELQRRYNYLTMDPNRGYSSNARVTAEDYERLGLSLPTEGQKIPGRNGHYKNITWDFDPKTGIITEKLTGFDRSAPFKSKVLRTFNTREMAKQVEQQLVAQAPSNAEMRKNISDSVNQISTQLENSKNEQARQYGAALREHYVKNETRIQNNYNNPSRTLNLQENQLYGPRRIYAQ